MTRLRRRRSPRQLAAPLAFVLATLAAGRQAAAQGGYPAKPDSGCTADTTAGHRRSCPAPADTHSPQQQPAAPKPAIDFSGVIFGNFQYHTEPAASAGANKDRFTVDRAYLTFRMPAGDRASIRATADIFANGTSGYDFRAKYAYLQYDFSRGAKGTALGRIGILHTAEIDHEETFWPRWISQVGTERNGFFSSADLGVATQLTLPNKFGEVYATITNGPGYANAGPDDRFKDYSVRLSLTPLARSSNRVVRTFTISPWLYNGDSASKFGPGSSLNNVPGALGTVTQGLERDRYGVLVGFRDPRLVLAGHWAERRNEIESDSNTVTNPARVTGRQTGQLISAYTVAKPFALLAGDSATLAPLGLVFRYDRFEPDKKLDPYIQYVVAGLTWDLTRRVSLALDYQETLPRNGQAPTAQNLSKIYFAQFVANF
ncbi:MAG: hypothetical protein ACJ79S_05735 [Gemmatimonadaceae bacterium]